MNILLELWDDIAHPFHDFQYLATGAVRDRLETARQALKQEQALLQDLKNHFNATRVTIASSTELNIGFPALKKSGGFKIYFPQYQQPEGWFRPAHWDKREFGPAAQQNMHDGYAYLPPQNSSAHIHLLQKQIEANGILSDSKLPTSKGIEYLSGSGWHYWSAIALYGENLRERIRNPTGKFQADIIAPGVFVLSMRSKNPDFSPEGKFASCPAISKLDAAWLRANPELADTRAERILNGKTSVRTVLERALGALRFNP